MYRDNRNDTCHMCSQNFDSLKTMNQNLERGMFEAIHIQYCIKTLQLKSDILHNKYVHKTTKFKLYEILKIFKYKFSDNIIFNFPQNIILETNQDILYNILQILTKKLYPLF